MTGVVVWGNCQAAPLAELMAPGLAAHGLQVVPVPPVYLATPAQLAEVHAAVRECAVLISQPVAENYPLPGCSTAYLRSLLPSAARVVTLPVLYHQGAFPFMCHGHGGDDARVDAPITDYHDLRMLTAAARNLDADDTTAWWPSVPVARARAVAAASSAELRRRETDLDVTASDLLTDPDRWWTVTHPSNAVLTEVARRVFAGLGLDAAVDPPAREFLGQRRAPLEPVAVDGLGGSDDGRDAWVVDGRRVELLELARTQLAFYAARPDVVRRTLAREAHRLEVLGLA